jgi:hypothetical protein
VDVFADPANRELGNNLINRTIDVEVPVGDVNNETQVHFVNQRDRGQLKVCKVLGANSSALDGQSFGFTVTSAGMPTQTPTIQASLITPQCAIVGNYPVGNTATVTENLDHSPMAPGEFIDTTGEGTITIAPGVNEVDVTNTAVGLLQVCKARITYLAGTQPTFRFRIDGGAMFLVQAGKCAPARRVAPGSHTVTELAEANYDLVDVIVSPASRLQSLSLANRSVTVDVPYAGNGNGETAVTFVNAVKRGQIKVCKVVQTGSLDALGTTDFTFSVSLNGGQPFTLGPIRNGECALADGDFPILTPAGTPTTVNVQEDPVPGVVVTDITFQGPGTVTGTSLCGRSISYNLGAGVNQATFTNAKGVVQPC